MKKKLMIDANALTAKIHSRISETEFILAPNDNTAYFWRGVREGLKITISIAEEMVAQNTTAPLGRSAVADTLRGVVGNSGGTQ